MGGADIFEGDSGEDQARFDWANTSISAHIGGVADTTGGATINADVEAVFGGSANDTLIGDNDANTLIGNVGNDTIYGNGGNDELYGYFSTDWSAPFEQNDQGVFGRNLAPRQLRRQRHDLRRCRRRHARRRARQRPPLRRGRPGRHSGRRGSGLSRRRRRHHRRRRRSTTRSTRSTATGRPAPTVSWTYHQNPFPDTVVCADDLVWQRRGQGRRRRHHDRCIHPTRYDNSWTTGWNEQTDIPIFDIPDGFSMVQVLRDGVVARDAQHGAQSGSGLGLDGVRRRSRRRHDGAGRVVPRSSSRRTGSRSSATPAVGSWPAT